MSSPYREPSMPDEFGPKRRSIAWLWGALAMGLVGGASVDRYSKPVREVEAPACKDQYESFNGGCVGTHQCPHRDHTMSVDAFGMACRCARAK